jgi:hypothetical protein
MSVTTEILIIVHVKYWRKVTQRNCVIVKSDDKLRGSRLDCGVSGTWDYPYHAQYDMWPGSSGTEFLFPHT